jgi:pimeloyl-ACP methyl ester carboxylesterase
MKSLIFIITALLLAVIPVAAQEDAVPRFEPADCPFDADGSVECGFVVVPEFHAQPDGDTIRLSVVIQRGSDPDAAPVILLSGGPGEKTTENAEFALFGGFSTLADDTRDFIVFDQRGVGLSEPALECPEYAETMLAWLEREPDPEASAQAVYDALLACRARLAAEGIDFAAYNTLENAADVAALTEALGYEQVNLVGVSYGSLLAQAVMRDYPEIVRSVVIDSVLPTTRSFFIDIFDTVTDSLTRLIQACSADAACDAAYPDLQQVLFDTIDELNANPQVISITDPLSGETYDAYLTGDALLGNLAIFLYQASLLPLLPQTIYDVSTGSYDLMAQLSGLVLPAYNALSRGMNYSVFCADDLIGRTPEELLAAYEALPPQYRGQADLEVLMETTGFALCEAWNVPALDDSVKEPIVSDIPTLVMGGQYDPVTPFSYAEEVAANLSNSYVYEYPAVGHSVINSNTCGASMAAAFITDPTTAPDDACIADLQPVQFAVPVTDVTFERFTNEAMGLTGEIPSGWADRGQGIYIDSASATRGLILQAFPGTPQQAVDLLSSQTGSPLEEGATETIGSYEWTFYQVTTQGFSFDVAVTSDGGTAVLAVLQVLPSERDQLFASIFLPVLATIQAS